MNRGKIECYSRIKDENGRLAVGEDEAQRIWYDYLEGLYNTGTQEPVAVHICVFAGVQGGNYFGGELIRRPEVEIRVGKPKNG